MAKKEKVKAIKFVGPISRLIPTLPYLVTGAIKCDIAHKRGDYEKEVKYGYEYSKGWLKKVCKILKVNIIIHNEENLPTNGGNVYIGNHQGIFDIVSFLSIVKEPTGAISKKEFTHFPIIGPWVRRIHGVFIDRSNARAAVSSIQAGVDNIKKGISMLIFPEGTRSRDGELQEFHKGSFKLATQAKADIIPITFLNAHKVVEDKGEFQENVNVHIYVHPPIKTSELTREELVALPETVRNIVLSKLDNSIE